MTAPVTTVATRFSLLILVGSSLVSCSSAPSSDWIGTGPFMAEAPLTLGASLDREASPGRDPEVGKGSAVVQEYPEQATQSGSWEAGIFLPWIFYGEIESLGETPDNSIGWGFRVGYWIDETNEIELAYQDVSTDLWLPGLGGSGFDTSALTLAYLYNFSRSSEFLPYLTAGAGTWDAEAVRISASDNGTLIYLGGGTRWFASEDFFLRLEAQVQQTFGDEDDLTNLALSLGAGLTFGG